MVLRIVYNAVISSINLALQVNELRTFTLYNSESK